MTKSFPKPLLIFAHRGEAKEFLFRDAPSLLQDFEGRLYEGDHYFLLICSEGINEAIFHSASVISKYGEQISQVVNFGIAGRLATDAPLNSIQTPRTVYYHDGREMKFTSFQNDHRRYFDLVTTSSRVLDKRARDYLAKFGGLVDREAWGISYVCQKFRKECQIFKLVSDDATDEEICKRAREHNTLYSCKLYEFFKKLLPRTPPKPKKEEAAYQLPEGFHFGQSQKQQFLELVSVLQSYPSALIEEINKLHPKKNPKDKTKILLERMRELSDPFTAHVKKELRRLSKNFQNDQFKLSYGQNFESSDIWIKAHIRDVYDFKSFQRRLEDLPYNRIYTLLENGPDVS